MKLKKLFAGIVAVAMMATMAIPGFAAGFAAGTVTKDGTVDATTDKTVNITVKYEGSGFGSDKIKLELDATDKGAPYAIKNSSIKDVTTVAGKAIQVSSTETQVDEATAPAKTMTTLTVTLPDYANVGTYFYKLKQAEGATAGMEYDTAQLYLMVNVINADSENVTGGYLCKAALFTTDPENLSGDNLKNAKIDCLTNKYTNGQFTATKKVKGNMADRNETFNFQAKFTKAVGLEVKGDIKAQVADAAATAVNNRLTWTPNEDGTTESAIYDFDLKHGQSAVFTNIPNGMTITVYEVAVAENGSKTELKKDNLIDTYKVDCNKDTQTLTVDSKNNKTSGSTTIINDSQVNVNTGVILDNAPYIALLTIVAAGAVVMIMKKRRNYED